MKGLWIRFRFKVLYTFRCHGYWFTEDGHKVAPHRFHTCHLNRWHGGPCRDRYNRAKPT